MGSFIDDAGRERIAAAVRRVEQATAGELVTVVARRADGYWGVVLLWASFAALAAPALLWPLAPGAGPQWAAQLLLFTLAAGLGQWPPLRRRLVPRAVQRHAAARLAREQFYARGLHRTRDRTGVLLFVAVEERYVEILADAGIDAKLPPGSWAGIVAGFTAAVREGRVADGFVAAIEESGGHLARHFPPAADDRNELPDRLVEL